TKGGLLQDSYRWVLDNAEFQRWRDRPERRLLWIKGDPGGIINELHIFRHSVPQEGSGGRRGYVAIFSSSRAF
ncbi:hypothetical protein C8A01DRAFT_21494, partial [Parachaetomium inaequale]